MKTRDAAYVLECIDQEGFDYCFRHYSSFKNIEDEKFHLLREAYEASADALEEYLERADTL